MIKSLSDAMTRDMDFAGGTVIHVSWPSILFVLLVFVALILWSMKRKR